MFHFFLKHMLKLGIPLKIWVPAPSEVSLCRICSPKIAVFRPFLSDPGIPGVRSMGPSLSNWVTIPYADLTDVTLADEDTNSKLADNANKAIQGNVAMQVTQVAPSGGQILNWCKWRHLVTKFVFALVTNFITNASGAIWWPNFELIQVEPHWPNLWPMQILFSWRDNSS